MIFEIMQFKPKVYCKMVVSLIPRLSKVLFQVFLIKQTRPKKKLCNIAFLVLDSQFSFPVGADF